MDIKQIQTLEARQRRVEEINLAIKQSELFFDEKAFLEVDGKQVLLTRKELRDLVAKEEAEIRKIVTAVS